MSNESVKHDPLDRLIADSAERSFGPHFAGRVMERLPGQEPSEHPPFAALLWTRFCRVAVAASIAAAGLAVYNTTQSAEDGYAASPIEAVLALPPFTLDAAFDLPGDVPSAASTPDARSPS